MNIGTIVKFKVQLEDGWCSGHGVVSSQREVAGRDLYGIKITSLEERCYGQRVSPFYNGDAIALEKRGVMWRVLGERFIGAFTGELEAI